MAALHCVPLWKYRWDKNWTGGRVVVYFCQCESTFVTHWAMKALPCWWVQTVISDVFENSAAQVRRAMQASTNPPLEKVASASQSAEINGTASTHGSRQATSMSEPVSSAPVAMREAIASVVAQTSIPASQGAQPCSHVGHCCDSAFTTSTYLNYIHTDHPWIKAGHPHKRTSVSPLSV